jgi:hypothetical protein
MNWNEVDDQLEIERFKLEDKLIDAHRLLGEVRRLLRAQRRYIQELEAQLEPGVIAEIRSGLEASKS